MKKFLMRCTAVFLVILFTVSLLTISVSQAVSYTNSKGTVTVVCGKYKKKFKAKKYGNNFSKALNAALDKARTKATANKIATVTVSKGNYSLDRTLKIYSNTTLKASGCTFRLYGNLLRNGYDNKAYTATEYNGASNITINGGTWDAAVPYSQAGTANWRIQHSTMRFGHVKNLVIKNCTFRNNYNCHDIELGGVDTAKITKCSFYNDKGVNIFKNDGGREAIQLDVNTSAAMPEFGKYDYTPCKNITLSYSSFKNKFRAIGSHHAVLGNTFDNIKVHHNTFTNIGGITVYAVYWTNSKVYSNTFSTVGLGVDIRSMTTGAGDNFRNYNKLTYTKAENAVNSSKFYVYDNTISIRKSNNTYVRHCGIRVMGENYAKNDSTTGVKAGTYKVYGINIGVNANGTAKPNTIKGNLDVGIQLNYAVKSLVKNNSINAGSSISATSNGIEIKGCEETVVDSNTVKNGNIDGARGIYLTPTAAGGINDKVTVSNNKVTNFKMSGLYVYKSNNSILENNTINKSPDMGVAVRKSANTTVSENTIKNSNSAAVYVYSGSDNITVEKNTVSATTLTAFKLRDSASVKVQDNSITDSGEYGVLVRGCDKTELLENTINKTGSYGVRVNYGSDNTEIYNNSIVSSSSECIYLNGVNDTTKEKEKSLVVAQNYLEAPDKTAAVSVAYDNVAARIYSNYRTDGSSVFYRFKGDDDEKYTKVTDPLSIEELTLEKCEGYNMLNWSDAGDGIAYRVFRDDETGNNLISDTPENFCLDNNIYKKVEPETTSPDSDGNDDMTLMEKLKITGYSVSAYKAFTEVKFLGEPISVDFDK